MVAKVDRMPSIGGMARSVSSLIRKSLAGSAALVAALVLAGCGDRDKPDGPVEGELDGLPPVEATAPGTIGPTLASVRRRGRLNCGVHEGLVGFAYTDNRGQWRGFDVDFCRAMAAAIFNNPDAVRFVPLTTGQRFEALRQGRVDVVWRNTSWTMDRDVTEDVSFAGTNYYDGQGFLVRRSLNLSSAAELNGARICVQAESTSQLNLADYFRLRGLDYVPVVVASEEEARRAYAGERCDAFTADVSALAAARTTLASPEQHAILPEIISKEPLGPMVRRDDPHWTRVVRWTLNALILAEEYGVTRDTAASQLRDARDPRVRRLLGAEGEFGARLGLSNSWAYQAISAVGNYGEIFNRNLGSDSALNLARGLNAQWNATPAGLIYGLPIR